jgi:hypothetical protein
MAIRAAGMDTTKTWKEQGEHMHESVLKKKYELAIDKRWYEENKEYAMSEQGKRMMLADLRKHYNCITKIDYKKREINKI